MSRDLLARFQAIVGVENCISEPDQLVAYECDALPHLKARPGLVVLPKNRDEVVQVVKLAYGAKLPIVPRGSGTGLSGGAMPIAGCLLLGLSRMRRIIDGREVETHGDRDMPVWGESFRSEAERKKYPELTTLLKAKIIAEYVSTLQK